MPGPEEQPFTTMVDQRRGYVAALNSMNAGTYKASGDVIDWTMWDTVDLVAASTETRMFINSRGVVVGAAARNLADTNVIGRQGGVPQGQKLYVKAIKAWYVQDADDHTEAFWKDWYAFLESTTINVDIASKASYGQWTLLEIFNQSVAMMLEPAAAADNYALGTVSRGMGILPLNLPIVLASNVTFDITLQTWLAGGVAANLAGDKLKIGLCGILERLS